MCRVNVIKEVTQRLREAHARYTLYALLTPIFLSALAISNFPYKLQLIASFWFVLLIKFSHLSNFLRLLKSELLLATTTILLSFYIALASYLQESGTNNFLTAGAFLVWIPVLAIVASECQQNKERALIGIFGVMLTATVIIASALAWQRYVIGSARPLGLGHNVISGPLVCILSVACHEIARTSTTISKIDTKLPFIKISFTLLVASSLTTDSRTGLLCAILCIFFIISNKKVDIYKNKLIFSATALAIMLFYHDRFFNVFADIHGYMNGDLYSSIGSRFEAYVWSYKTLGEHLVFGKSLEGVTEIFNSRYDNNLKPVEFMPHLHNDFLQLTAAFGLPAAILFGLLLLLFYRRSNRVRQHDMASTEYPVFKNGLQVILLCLLTVSCFDSLTYNTESLLAFTVIIGVSLAILREHLPSRA